MNSQSFVAVGDSWLRRSARPLCSRKCRRGASLLAAFALAATGAHAAQITDAHRSLQVVIELVDSNPLAGDEVFDIQGPTSPLNATYRGLAQTGTTQNDNTASGSATMDTTLDVAGLKFSGSGGTQAQANLNFDSLDVSGGAFVDINNSSLYSVIFTIASSGTLTLNGSLSASGPGQLARVRLEPYNGSGLALWSKALDTGATTFTANVTLTQGTYIVYASCSTLMQGNSVGPATIQGNCSFQFAGQITEVTPPKKKPRG
jgi:hypothetical protein